MMDPKGKGKGKAVKVDSDDTDSDEGSPMINAMWRANL
jgi:hypothetical protein